VSGVAACLLIVWSYASGAASRERGGRTRLQNDDNQHNTSNDYGVARMA
jgi:hypothetical protein